MKKHYILHFMLEGIHFCVDLNTVKKVLSLTFIEKVPKSPKYLVGFMNLSGKSISVIDLALRLDLNRKNSYSLHTPIILCQEKEDQIGIVVDSIVGVETIEENALQVDKNVLDKDSPILGVIEMNSDLLLMLDVSKIVDKNIAINKVTI